MLPAPATLHPFISSSHLYRFTFYHSILDSHTHKHSFFLRLILPPSFVASRARSRPTTVRFLSLRSSTLCCCFLPLLKFVAILRSPRSRSIHQHQQKPTRIPSRNVAFSQCCCCFIHHSSFFFGALLCFNFTFIYLHRYFFFVLKF